jgi:hypothetical protein
MLLVSQDGQRPECAAEVATGSCQGGLAGDPDGRDTPTHTPHLTFHDHLCSEISAGHVNVKEGS